MSLRHEKLFAAVKIVGEYLESVAATLNESWQIINTRQPSPLSASYLSCRIVLKIKNFIYQIVNHLPLNILQNY